ncbi:hypothetical protein DKW60_13870 [Leucothrix pacifica]|uniref:Uncharacterized protein n=1 Tax=Leucothrix pacifica TaxID=1247513 RepID=A0A317CB35_9GAMM|nr:hypothetical protein DKW60_13870 [Leucothrix pacifica]
MSNLKRTILEHTAHQFTLNNRAI